jgi:peptidoglycan/LPS O-acetylase OafA/YrhL
MNKIPLLNGLRALAIFGVIWQHSVWAFFAPGLHPVSLYGVTLPSNPVASNGWLGVNLFFFCSGLVLFLPYCNGTRQFRSPADDRWFWKHRAKRLLPLYYLSLLLGCSTFLIAADIDKWTVARAIPAFLCLSTFFSFTFFPIGNWVLWSLEIEILFSALFPRLVRLADRHGMERLLVWSVVLCLGLRALGNVYFRGEPYLNFLSDNIFGRLDDFVWGMFAARLYARDKLPRHGGLIVLGGFFMLGAGILSDFWLVKAIPAFWQSAAYTLFDLGVFLLVSGLLAGRSLLRRVLESRVLQVVGMMCFSIYVWHGIILNHLYPNILDTSYTIEEFLQGLPAYLFLLAGVSLMSYRYIEFPQTPWRELFMLEAAKRPAFWAPIGQFFALRRHRTETREIRDEPDLDASSVGAPLTSQRE